MSMIKLVFMIMKIGNGSLRCQWFDQDISNFKIHIFLIEDWYYQLTYKPYSIDSMLYTFSWSNVWRN